MSGIGRFDRIALSTNLKQQVDEAFQPNVPHMRSTIATPTTMNSNQGRRTITQGKVKYLNPSRDGLSIALDTRRFLLLPEARQAWFVHLQDQARVGHSAIFVMQDLGK